MYNGKTYQYWIPIGSDQHHLYPSEVAEQWEIFSVGNKLSVVYHSKLVSNILKAYAEGKEPPMYYETRNGMKRVYSQQVIDGAYKWLLKESKGAGICKKFHLNGTNYVYFFGYENRAEALLERVPYAFDAEGNYIRPGTTKRVERKKELEEEKKNDKKSRSAVKAN